jgi:uncharacterized damage-inducible protein DinB
MIGSIDEFRRAWRDESAITSRVLGALTDASLGQRVTPNDRSLGDMAWHLVTTITEMAGLTGLTVRGPAPDAPPPFTAAPIRAAYDAAAAGLVEQVSGQWTDATLAVEDEMYGEKWPRGATLSGIIVHQIHHRGAMTVLMRQAGLTVPSIYGPNREETEAMRG